MKRNLILLLALCVLMLPLPALAQSPELPEEPYTEGSDGTGSQDDSDTSDDENKVSGEKSIEAPDQEPSMDEAGAEGTEEVSEEKQEAQMSEDDENNINSTEEKPGEGEANSPEANNEDEAQNNAENELQEVPEENSEPLQEGLAQEELEIPNILVRPAASLFAAPAFAMPDDGEAIYPYAVQYYKDSLDEENLLDEVIGETLFSLGHVLTASDIANDLGTVWLDRLTPSGYARGEVQGHYPTIGRSDNIVLVLYVPWDSVSHPKPPVIYAQHIRMVQDTPFDPLTYEDVALSAEDPQDGDLSDAIEVSANTVDVTTPGVYRVEYQVTNSVGLTTAKAITVTIVDPDEWAKERGEDKKEEEEEEPQPPPSKRGGGSGGGGGSSGGGGGGGSSTPSIVATGPSIFDPPGTQAPSVIEDPAVPLGQVPEAIPEYRSNMQANDNPNTGR